MIFLTTGSMLPFDRLIRTVDEAIVSGIIKEPVFGQIGESSYLPKNFQYERFLDTENYNSQFDKASLVIGHAGIGVIVTALSKNVSLLIMARQKEFGEHVNDHQVSTASKFEALGHVLTFEPDTLKQKLELVKDFEPTPRVPNAAGLGDKIANFLSSNINQ